MRINIFEAGLVTYLMAGRGFLPKEDEQPPRSVDMESWNSRVLPAVPASAKAPRKDDQH
jgi:hypothetical protein